MNNPPEIKDIDAALLTGPVRQALGSPSAEISHWEHTPISYVNTEESNLGLRRFEGGANDKGAARPWSIVLKAVRAPLNDTDPTHWNYHRREILAYQSRLLTDLPGGLQAPRCFGVTEYSEGVCWLWLEDVLDSVSLPWSLAEYGLAARHLGQFNGAYAAEHPLPALPWLSRDWLRGWLNYYEADCRDTLQLIRDERFWENPLLRNAFPQPVTDDILRLWASHEVFLAALDQLPQTFCHMDAYRPNLFIRRSGRGAAQRVTLGSCAWATPLLARCVGA